MLPVKTELTSASPPYRQTGTKLDSILKSFFLLMFLFSIKAIDFQNYFLNIFSGESYSLLKFQDLALTEARAAVDAIESTELVHG